MSCDLGLANSFNCDLIYRDFTVADGLKHKTLLCNPIEQILAKANNCAREILGKEPKPILPKIKKENLSDKRPPASSNTASPKVTLVTLIGATANIGKSLADMLNIDNEKSQIYKIFNAYKFYERPDSPNVKTITAIYSKYQGLLSKKRANATRNFWLGVTLISSATLLAASVVAASTAGMVASGSIVAATLAVIAFKFFFNQNLRGSQYKIAEDIQQDWKSLQIKERDLENAEDTARHIRSAAERFSRTLSPEDKDKFRAYTLDIVLSQEFLKNPKAYIENWIKKRDGKVSRIPEDLVLKFFASHYNIS
jgi:hypothetical protein